MSQFPTIMEAHDQLAVQMDNWSNWLVEILSNLSNLLGNPDFNVAWGSVEAALPEGWGGAFVAPTPLKALSYGDIVKDGPAAPMLLDYPDLPDALLYIATLSEVVITRVREIIEGAPLIDNSIFYGIYDEAKGRLADTFVEEFLEAGVKSGMAGELPTESHFALHDAAIAKYRMGLQKVSLEGKEQHVGMLREDSWKAMETGRTTDKMLGDLYYRGKSYQISRIGAVIEENKALLAEFSALWGGIKTHADAALAAARAVSMPGDFQARSEQVRAQVENTLLARIVENAKLATRVGTSKAELVQEQLHHVGQITTSMRDTIAHVAAAIAGSYTSAAQVTLHGSAADALVTETSTITARNTTDSTVEVESHTESSATIEASSESTITKT